MVNDNSISSKTPSSRPTRRQFLQQTALAAGAVTFAAPAIVRGRNLNEKLNIAIIGSGGRGAHNLSQMATENIVVLCDVNEAALNGKATQKYPDAKRFTDFRKVYDDANKFDAVVVSTCEHTHAFATLPALQLGKHVYCEKPLTHNIWEARVIREAAAKTKLATQMGIQIHASNNYRSVVELIQAGAIGPVREAHVWVSRAWGRQSEEESQQYKDIVFVNERPPQSDPIPAGLDWELWLGPAPYRPFNNAYFPGPKWYRWWDFGNGTMSDLGSHWNDLPFWALKLKAPLTVEAFGPPPHAEIAPASMRAVYEFGPRGDMPAVTMTWYQGTEKPDLWKSGQIPQYGNGVLFVGDKGMLLSDYSKHVLLPAEKFAGFKGPEPTLPRYSSEYDPTIRPTNHHTEWIHACKTGEKCSADFEYSGWLTESNHLGNVAYRAGKKLQWDPVNLRATNCPEADAFIRRQYREGWKLGKSNI